MQVYFISLRFTEDETPKTNFDNFQNAMLAVFQVSIEFVVVRIIYLFVFWLFPNHFAEYQTAIARF